MRNQLLVLTAFAAVVLTPPTAIANDQNPFVEGLIALRLTPDRLQIHRITYATVASCETALEYVVADAKRLHGPDVRVVLKSCTK